MKLPLPRTRKVFLCWLISSLVGSVIFILTWSTHPINKRGTRDHNHAQVKSRDQKSYQKFTSWESTPADDDDETHESLYAENANAMANVFANVEGAQNHVKRHRNGSTISNASEIKGFPELFPQETHENTTLNFDKAVHNYKERVNQNLTQTQLEQFVIVTTVNFEFHHLFDNWLASVTKLGLIYNIMLICEDNQSYKYYSSRQSDHFKVLNTLDYQMQGKLEGKKGTYQQLIKRRTMYVRNLLFAGVDVLLVDIDAVWLKDPLEVVRQSYTIYDIWIAQGYDPGVPCPCFLYMKSVPSIMKVAGAWMHRLADKKKVRTRRGFESDQFALKYVLMHLKNLRMLSLDKVRFPTGKEFFDTEWNKMNLEHVYIAHGNHLGRKEGKVEKFKEYGLWLLDN